MIELRWLTWEEEENIVPPVHEIQFGKAFDKRMVVKRRLQYRQKYNATIYAGMPSEDFKMQTAQMVWSEWRDVPDVVERDLSCP